MQWLFLIREGYEIDVIPYFGPAPTQVEYREAIEINELMQRLHKVMV